MRRLPDAEFWVPEPARRRRRQDEIDAAVEAARHVLVVSHARCLDGVGSYLIHALAAESPPAVVYTHPNEIPAVLARVARVNGNGRTLSINDLSFDRKRVDDVARGLGRAREAGWRIVWRDHHHMQWEGVDTAALEAHLERFVLDREAKECGTSLAQQDLLADDPMAKELADIVRDRDLWHNNDPRSERYEFALRQLGTEHFVEAFLATRDVDAPWIKAAAEEERRRTDEEVEQALLTAELFGDEGELGVIYGEVPKNVTLHELRRRRGTRMEINLKPDGTFSIRSAKGTDVAHLVGQAYGGGGHPNAAGGKLEVPFWEWPTFWLKGGLSPSGRSVVRTALRLIAESKAARAAGDDGPTIGTSATNGKGDTATGAASETAGATEVAAVAQRATS